MPGGGACGPCPDFASNTLAFALQLRKITENLGQGNRMALGCSAPNAIRSALNSSLCGVFDVFVLPPFAACLTSLFFWAVTWRRLVIGYRLLGQPVGPIVRSQAFQDCKGTFEDGTDRLY